MTEKQVLFVRASYAAAFRVHISRIELYFLFQSHWAFRVNDHTSELLMGKPPAEGGVCGEWFKGDGRFSWRFRAGRINLVPDLDVHLWIGEEVPRFIVEAMCCLLDVEEDGGWPQVWAWHGVSVTAHEMLEWSLGFEERRAALLEELGSVPSLTLTN